ncbi:tetratricopeptide repeat protein [Myxococcus qinghaiensis]|uniref:tetratricopeptide repeat protein n=1 Tax=Myxococcus qinghaiensis TaxID=2906758 RepID=UPI0020A82A89|nr:hypothetical protein [Myxococcus qinghaiensis]MCP3169671.1 hypothetical protein [Myxococcus qinghaiensis]
MLRTIPTCRHQKSLRRLPAPQKHWKSQNIKRFILFVACSLDSTQCQSEITAQIKKFKRLGIIYETWPAARIRNKLRAHPEIVSTYFSNSEYWLREICGRPLASINAPTSSNAPLISSLLASQLEQLSKNISNLTSRDLEHARNKLRQGYTVEAIAWAASIKNDNNSWPALTPAIRARILCFEASLALHEDIDPQKAQALISEAQALSPIEDYVPIEAMIARINGHEEHAITLLHGRSDPESRELYASLLIETGRQQEAWPLLQSDELKNSAGGRRLRALAFIADKNITGAKLEIQQALELEPHWESNRYTAAIINYYSTLSPTSIPSRIDSWPEPIDLKLVRRDDESIETIRKSAHTFSTLAAQANSPSKRRRLEAWQLACLLNDPERQEDAISFCREILATTPAHAYAIPWAVTRNLNIDLTPCAAALERLTSSTHAQIPEILALTTIHLSTKNAQGALALLEKNRDAFKELNQKSLWAYWWAQSLILDNNPQGALDFIRQQPTNMVTEDIELLALKTLNNTLEETRDLAARLEVRFRATGQAEHLLEACGLMARHHEWGFTASRAEELVETIKTADSLHLAVTCAYNNNQPNLCLKLLDQHRNLLPQKRLTSTLRRIRISCLSRSGGLSSALHEAEELLREEPSLENRWRLASILFETGDFRRLSLVAREIEVDPNLNAPLALRLAHVLHSDDAQRTLQLFRRALELTIPDDMVGSAISIAAKLGIETNTEVRPLFSRMQSLAQSGRGGFQMKDVRDLVLITTQNKNHAADLEDSYRRGETPIHVLAAEIRGSLATTYRLMLLQNEANPRPLQNPALLIRHGRRPQSPTPINAPKWRVRMDVTAMLLAEHLELLDAVEHTFKPIEVAPSLMLALHSMRSKTTHHQPARLHAIETLISMVDRGEISVAPPNTIHEHLDPLLAEELGTAWAKTYEFTRAHNGYLVDYLPIQKPTIDLEPVNLPTEISARLASCWSITETLREANLISKKAYGEAVAHLGHLSEPDNGIKPPIGSLLFICVFRRW